VNPLILAVDDEPEVEDLFRHVSIFVDVKAACAGDTFQNKEI
jgi:hypothetical protein